MGEKGDIVDAFKRTFHKWRDDPKIYILASLEVILYFFLFNLVHQVLFIALLVAVFLHEGNIFIEDTDTIFPVLQMGPYLFSVTSMILVKTILDGGMVSMLESRRRGVEYRFFDILKKGMIGLWRFIRVKMTIILLFFLSLTLLISPLVLAMIIIPKFLQGSDLALVLLLVVLAGTFCILIIMIAAGVLFYPLQFLSFIHSQRKKRGGIPAVYRGLKWIMKNKGVTFVIGFIYLVILMISRNIPIFGIALVGPVNLFFLGVFMEMYNNN